MGAVALAVLTCGQLAAEGPGWVWDGAKVHPGCIRELTTALSDRLPVVAAVDLEGCRRSSRYSSPAEVAGPSSDGVIQSNLAAATSSTGTWES